MLAAAQRVGGTRVRLSARILVTARLFLYEGTWCAALCEDLDSSAALLVRGNLVCGSMRGSWCSVVAMLRVVIVGWLQHVYGIGFLF
jgi:hypothetical protein